MQWSVIEANSPALAKTTIEKKLGIEVFAPQCHVRVRHGRRISLVPKPLMYGYIFARFDLRTDPWQSIFSARGVESVMCAGGIPRRVPDHQIEAVRKIAARYDGVVLEASPLKLHQVVRVIEGVFAGHDVTVAWMDESPDIGVTVTVFGHAHTVKVSRDNVRSLAA